jgi:hypothetical protein
MGGPLGDGGLLTSGVETSVRARPDTDGNFGRVQAMNLETMELAWQHRSKAPATIATLSTDGGLVFAGRFSYRQGCPAVGGLVRDRLWAEAPPVGLDSRCSMEKVFYSDSNNLCY